MMDVVDYHMDVRSTKEDIETEDNSDSGLEECGTSPISNTSTNRSISSPISSSYESDHIKTNIPFRPQIITPSEGSAFSKIEKLITHSSQPAAFPPVNFGVPSSVGYIPGFFVPPWAAAGFNHQNYLASLSKKPATTSDSESEDQPEKEQNKNVFNEVDTSIPFTNYFQNLTKLLQKTQANGVKLEESEESENEPGEITKRNRPELTNLYRNVYQSTEHQSLQHMDDNGTNRRVGMNPGVFPNGHALSMAQLIGPHPYFSTTPSQLPQFSPNSQMYQYFGGIQPPTGLLHPALLHMAGLRSRRINTEKPPPIKKYKCDVCGKAFSRSNTLVTHKRIHTGDKPFKCEVCGRAFRQPGNLTRHRLTHTTVKPYVCPSCNKAFNRASNLHTHMRTHTNFKPFTCPYCGKGFHQKIDMKIHCYTHTGERPHRCDICGKGFTLISTLNAHRRIHTETVAEPEMA